MSSPQPAQQVEWGTESERITVRVPVPLLEEFDAAADQGHYQNRSEAFREAIRQFVQRQGDSE